MFLDWLSRTTRRVSQRTQAAPRRFRPRLETLESRETPALAPAPGLLDLTFGSGGKVITPFDLGSGTAVDDEAKAVATQPDGKIIAAGGVDVAAQNLDFGLVRYNRDGSLDETFDGNGKAVISFDLGGDNFDTATGVAVLPSGKILVSGIAQTGAASGDFAICRLNPDGSLDPTFGTDGKFTVDFNRGGPSVDFAIDIAVQPDGKIVLAGNVTTSATTSVFAVARIKPNGGLDPTFGVSGKATVEFELGELSSVIGGRVALTPAGKIVLAGSVFSAGVSHGVIAQLTPSGARDTTFSADGRFEFASDAAGGLVPNDLAVQPDGRIVVAGSAGDHTGVARLTPLGTLDASFGDNGVRVIPVSETAGDSAMGVVLQPDGKIVVTGSTQDDIFVLRLRNDGSADPFFANGNGLSIVDLPDSDEFPSRMALSADGIVVAGLTRDATTNNNTNFIVVRIHRDDWVVVGQDEGGSGTVRVFTPTGTPLFQIKAAPARFKGGIRVATGDINGDKADTVPEIFTAQGPGGRAVVKIFDGFTRQLIRQIKVHPKFTGGLNIAVGDVLGDSRLELLVAYDAGGRPDVMVFDPQTGALLKKLRVYGGKFRGGVRLAVGHFDASAGQELCVAPGPGAPTVVKIINLNTDAVVQATKVFGGKRGAFVAAGNLTGGMVDDLIVGAGSGAPVVKLIIFSPSGMIVQQHTVFARSVKGGVRVAIADLQHGGPPEIIVAAGPGASLVKVLDAEFVAAIGQFTPFGRKARTGFFVAGGVR